MKYKAVLFDLDGTLINTIDDLSNATNYMLKSYKYPLHTTEEYKYMVGNGMRKLVERALPENHRSDAEITEALEVFMGYYNKHSLDFTAPYSGTKELVKTLESNGVKTAVVTNKADAAAKTILADLFPGCFDVIIGQIEGVPTKPDPTSAHNAIKALGVEPEECVFMGDSGVDVQTAANSGAFAVGVLWGFRKEDELRENGAKAVIKTPDELLKIVL